MNVEPKTEKSQTQLEQARQWDSDLADTIQMPPQNWQEPGYNAAHFFKTGLLLGGVAGCTSLLVNVMGSVLWPAISGEPQHPLRIIQVFLTFPFGEFALQLNSGVLLALGCILYLTTGMAYGAVFVLAMSYLLPHAGAWARLVACSFLALSLWVINFYFLLAWLQPIVLGGRWIAELIPWWVGALTHLVFGWTIAVVYPAGASMSAAQTEGSRTWVRSN